MTIATHRPRVLLVLFAAAVLTAGLMALVGAKPTWAELDFTQAQNYPVGPYPTYPTDLTAADFDGDGNAADLAVANHGGGDIGGTGCCNRGFVMVLSSNGDGTFSESYYIDNAPGMWRPDSLATADFDQDGVADLAIAQETNPDRGVVAVSLGNGDGTFNEGVAFTADYYPTYVIAEDLNNDNYPDLAVANREAFDEGDSPRKVSVLLNIPPPGATTSNSGPSGTAGDPRPSFQLASSETNPSQAGNSAAAAGNTTRISVAPSGAQLNASSSGGASISSDGRYVVFTSTSPELVANDTNNRTDVFVRDRTTGTIRRVSVDSSGNQANGACNEFACEGSSAVSISSSGRYVAFNSAAFNLVANDTNDLNDIFVRDRDTDADGVFDEADAAATERANLGGCASQANRGGFSPFISSDGRYVTFSSQSTNLVANDANVNPDFFVRDRNMRTTQRVSVSSSGTESHLGGGGSSISSDGRFAAFASQALDLVANDTNGFTDVFLRDLGDAPLQDDCTAPTTTHTVSPLPNANGWNNSNVTVTLSAQDNEGGSDVQEIRYSATGAQSISETVFDPQNPPIINIEGTTTITYFATDNAGNRESPAKILTVKIDKGAPTVGSVSPAHAATGVSLTAKAEATFSEAMDPNTLSPSTFTLTRQNSSTPVAATMSYDSTTNKATLNPGSDLASNTTYTATVKGGDTGAKDSAGNALVQDYSWTFTTGPPPDTTAPKVSTETPTGTGVARGTNAIATFSERMDPTTITTSTFKLYKCSSTTSTNCATQITNVTVTQSTDRLKATLNPFGTSSTLLAGRTKFKVVVTTGAKDEAGNILDQEANTSGNQQKLWYFTTGRS